MDRESALELVSTLSDSTHRLSILEYLSDESAGIGQVGSALDIPRATARHNLQRLEEAGLVESSGSTYAVTTLGSYVCDHLSDCLEGIAVSGTLLPFHRVVPESAFDPDPSAFRGAEVVPVSPSNPHAPVEHLVDLVRGAGYLRAVTPVVLPRLAEAIHDVVVEDGGEVDLIAPADAVATGRDHLDDGYDEALETDRLLVGIHPGAVPFGLFLLDDERVALVGHDDENIPRCVVEEDADAALAWANDAYREFEQSVETYRRGGP